jgi:CDP-diacylglycerol--glycerol-3-phosphate 3-phosphatidyltransferase
MVIISREFIVTGIRLVAAGEGIVIAASGLGKIKTVIQMVAIVAALLRDFPLSLLTDVRFDRITMLVAVAVTVYSGYDYVKKNIHLLIKPTDGEETKVPYSKGSGIKGLNSKGAR